jgi:L-lactate utilization protein LutC
MSLNPGNQFYKLKNGAILDNLKHQCDVLKPGTEQVIQLTKRELDEQFTRVIKNAGCKAVITRENGKTVVKVSKPKQESDDDLLAGISLDDL